MKYGVTEVFVKHDYFSNLRVKLIRRVDERIILCEYLGDSVSEIEEIATDRKIYPIPIGFFLMPLGDDYGYIYEDGEYSFYRYKYIKHVGSSRSSKSWSLEEAAIRKCEQNQSFRLTVWRDTRTSLAETVWKDFRKVFPLSGRRYKFPQDTKTIHLGASSTIEPHGDDSTNAHGLTQDIAWLNEPYKMAEYTFNQIDQRADQIWIDINPKQGHWSDKLDQHPRCKTIHSTFDLNPFCPIEQRLKILSYNPDNPINVANGTDDLYKWQVYGLGLKAEKPNRIFSWKKIPLREYLNIDVKKYVGCDWGKVDPWGIVEAKYLDGKLYLRELNYASENEIRAKLTTTEKHVVDAAETTPETKGETGIVTMRFNQLGIEKSTDIVCDTNRPLKTAALRRAGYHNANPAPSKSILDGIDLLDNLEIFYTDDSHNLEYEQENYSRKVDKLGAVEDEPEDQDNHLMDPTRYIALYLQMKGVIRVV